LYKSIVVIPTYNEKENIERMILKMMSLKDEFHVLFVDDSSPDGTPILIKQAMEKFPNRIFIQERPEKLGLGTAYIHGFKWAIERKYDYIFEMDCDFSHNPDDLSRLQEACSKNGADLSIGSRYVKGGKVVNWPLKRLLLSFVASLYVRAILWINIRDTTAGFICYKRQVLEKMNLDDIKFKGYAFQIYMKYATIRLGFSVKEIPITFVDRIYGESKMSTSIFKEAFWGVWKMKLKRF